MEITPLVRERSRVQSSLAAPFSIKKTSTCGSPNNEAVSNVQENAAQIRDDSRLIGTNPVQAYASNLSDQEATNGQYQSLFLRRRHGLMGAVGRLLAALAWGSGRQ